MFLSATKDPSVTHITVLSRRPLPDWIPLPSGRPSVEVEVLPDFLNYPADLSARLATHDACIWALGRSANGVSEEEYTKLTYGYVAHALEALEKGGVAGNRTAKDPFRFVFVSGEGADPEEKTMMMFGRIKVRSSLPCASIHSSDII